MSPDVLEVLRMHPERQEAERTRLGAAWPHTLEVFLQRDKKLELMPVENDFVFTSEIGTLLYPRNLERT